MAESIRFAVVRWNRHKHQAQAVVVDETRALEIGHVVHTVRQSTGGVIDIPRSWGAQRLRRHFQLELRMPETQIAVVEVSASLAEGVARG